MRLFFTVEYLDAQIHKEPHSDFARFEFLLHTESPIVMQNANSTDKSTLFFLIRVLKLNRKVIKTRRFCHPHVNVKVKKLKWGWKTDPEIYNWRKETFQGKSKCSQRSPGKGWNETKCFLFVLFVLFEVKYTSKQNGNCIWGVSGSSTRKPIKNSKEQETICKSPRKSYSFRGC